MEAWVRDARFALRAMGRHAGFTAIVVVTLALGIGSSTAVFSVVEGILLRPLPYPDSDQLVVIWQNDRATGTVRENASAADFFDYRERSKTFQGLSMSAQGTSVLTRDHSAPMQLNAALVSQNLASVLALEMQLGRNFTMQEDLPDGPAVVVLTDRLWRNAFAADPQILGRSITVDGVPTEVVGVLPEGVDYPTADTDLWTPIRQSPTVATRSQHWVLVLGRLAPGSSLAAGQAEMSRIMSDLEVEYTSDNRNRGAFVERLGDVGRGDVRLTLVVLFFAALAVLAIACVNVANLLLARGARRSRELAVLAAVGADARHITRKFFVEGALMTLLASFLGIALAVGGVRLLGKLAPAPLLLLGTPSVNGPVLAFALSVGVVICLGFGLLPTIQGRGLDLQKQLKDGRTADRGGAGYTLRRVLVAGQLSMAVVLLLGATLLIGTVRNLQAVDPGFRAESTLRVDFPLSASYTESMATYPDWPLVHQFIADLTAGVEGLPGVQSAAVVLNHPLDPGFTNSFRIEGRDYDESQGEMTTRLVTPSYFETSGLGLVAGRLLEDGDRVGAPNAIVLNRAAAERYFPEGDAIGQRIAFWGPAYRDVVGVVENERMHGLTVTVPPAMYVSMYQSPPLGGRITLMARTAVPPLSLVEGVRDVMRSVDPNVPIFNVSTMVDTLADAMSRERFASAVLTLFAAVALFLAVLGVHGVLAYLVAQRGHEVGVRMALGASRADVVGMIVRQGASMTVLGIAVGLLTALAMSKIVGGLLFGVSATSPLIYLGVGVAMALVALAATALPARRAAAISPASALRGE